MPSLSLPVLSERPLARAGPVGTGKAFWRSLDELADTAEFRRWLTQEFPPSVLECLDTLSRRHFLKLMAASFALAGLVGCRQSEDIVPYLRPVEGMTPGKPLYFASALTRGGFATGVVVESHEGRPTKIEGNPEHPASQGGTDVFTQAEILRLYDPDRSQTVMRGDEISTWDLFARALDTALVGVRAQQGRGLRILTGTITSPTLMAQMQTLLAALPQARWHAYEPISLDNSAAGTKLAFGQAADLVYRFEQADVILALDCDFLLALPGSARYARDFAARRRAALAPGSQQAMSRLYVVEPTPTITGARADHRLALRSAQIEPFVRALATELGQTWVPRGSSTPADPQWDRWIRAVARDLQEHRGVALVLAGPSQPPSVHALVCALNEALGSLGRSVVPIAPVAGRSGEQPRALAELAADIDAGGVDVLLIAEANPVYDAPADARWNDLLGKVAFTAHLGLYRDETARRCRWHLPLTHELETWSDARAFDGTAAIIQPLIAPLYHGRSPHELLALLSGNPFVAPRELVREYWRARGAAPDFETWWRDVLRRGVVPESRAAALQVSVQRSAVADALRTAPATQAASAPAGELELVFRPHATIWDGRYANCAWLQELPEPITKLTWDNAALVSPATAARLGLVSEDVVELDYRGRRLKAPVWVMPGQADDGVAIALGFGRRAGGHIANGVGCNAYALRCSDALWFERGLTLRKLSEHYALANPQHQHAMEGRDLLRSGTFEQFRRTPEALAGEPAPTESLYPEVKYTGQQWGMVIDLTSCIGCNACTIACQSENNIAVVGKDQVSRGRIMHWIRVDRYFHGDTGAPALHYQPVPCMHCERAPCELVCPVGATQHSEDGLNEMIYNRCVGTRYCSNNCPYKVRRFNFYRWTDDAPSLALQRNPEVTVRARGVMEKCTYCVQRIRAADITALKEGRTIRDGEIVTACQQVCPTEAIVFGDINDPTSRVAKLRAYPQNYSMLAELNTRPRTTYLTDVRNPNPELM